MNTKLHRVILTISFVFFTHITLADKQDHNHQNLDKIFDECQKSEDIDACLQNKLPNLLKRGKGLIIGKSSDNYGLYQRLHNETPLSADACENGSFDDGFTNWSGFRMKHARNALPLENGMDAKSPFFSNACNNNTYSETCVIPESGGVDPAVPLISTTLSGSSIRLGGTNSSSTGYGAEGISRKFVVTAANAIYSFKYAIVMDESHLGGDAAFFQARAIDSTGTTVDKYNELADSNNPFIKKHPSNPPLYYSQQYYRDWRCAQLDLSSHIGQEVTVYFLNSDCAQGGHRAQTYIDDVCVECDNSKEEGLIELDYQACHKDGDSFDVSGTFNWPNITGITGQSIELEIYQANLLVGTITSPTITGSNYTFNLMSSDFPNLGCFDIVAVQKYSFPNMDGVLKEFKNYSSKPIGGVQQGTKLGADNDICFSDCEPPKPESCLVLDHKLECTKSGWEVSFTNNTVGFDPTKLDIKSTTTGVTLNGTYPKFILDGALPNTSVEVSANGIIENGGTEKGNDLCCSADLHIDIPDEECPSDGGVKACMTAKTSPAGPFFDSNSNQWSFPLQLTSLNGNTLNEVKVTPVTAGVTMTNGPVYPVGTPSLSFTGVTAGQTAEFNFCAYNSSDKEDNETYDCCKMNVRLKIRESISPKDYQQLEVVK